MFSEGRAGKVKRLRNSSRARLAACDLRGRVHGEWIEARGRIVEDATTREQGYAALREKYGWKMRVGDWFATLTGRIDRRALLEFEPARGAGAGA